MQQEYFQSPHRRTYKGCNRYKIASKTLDDFGLIIDQGKRLLPKVVESDSMLSNPDEQIKNEVDKPFCCKFCGNENYVKYGVRNGKQNYMYKLSICSKA